MGMNMGVSFMGLPPVDQKHSSGQTEAMVLTRSLCRLDLRTALSARRRGQHTSSVPTATAGCAARARRSTGMAPSPGGRSSPGPRRDLQE